MYLFNYFQFRSRGRPFCLYSRLWFRFRLPSGNSATTPSTHSQSWEGYLQAISEHGRQAAALTNPQDAASEHLVSIGLGFLG